MAEKTWLIYRHINKTNGKSYIGQTHTATHTRWKNGKGYTRKAQAAFAGAINKYGWGNFEHLILEEGIPTVEEANEREKYWIAYYHTFIGDPQANGYNMTPGGGASDMVKQTIEKDGVYQKVFLCELPRFEAEGWRALSKKEVSKLYYEAHKEELRAKSREKHKLYYTDETKRIAYREASKLYARENRDKVKARQKIWMDNNVEHIKAQKAAWQEAHKEEQKEKSRQYYLANRERIIQRASARQQEKKDEVAAYKKAYRQGYRKRNKVEEEIK